MASIPVPIGSYARRDPRSGSRRLLNCFVDPHDPAAAAPQGVSGIGGDDKAPNQRVTLRRMAGISNFASNGTNDAVRGASMMQGVQYVVIGAILYSITATGLLTSVGTGIAGTGFVRMMNNTNCLFILVPNSTTAYTYCPALPTPFAAFTDPTFLSYGAIDIGYVDTYFVFLMTNGRGFYNDDGVLVSGTGPPTFTTAAVFLREFGTDPFVGMAIDHRETLCLGRKTSEGYVDAGIQTGSPFQSAPDAYMEIGCHPNAAYSIALQDQSVFWVAQDRTVRRRNGQTPTRVSNSAIEEILEKANLAGSYALTPTIGGHPLWVYTMPAQAQSIVYDCLMQEWFEVASNTIGYWQPTAYFNAFGGQYVGSGLSGNIGLLDTTVFTEFGAPQTMQFITGSIYDGHNRITHRRLELIMTAGQAQTLGNAPKITLEVSNDGGNTFYTNGQPQTLGLTGAYTWRATWFNLGQSRDRVYRVSISDPSPTYTVDIQAEVFGGKW